MERPQLIDGKKAQMLEIMLSAIWGKDTQDWDFLADDIMALNEQELDIEKARKPPA